MMKGLFQFQYEKVLIAPNKQIPTTLGAIILSVVAIFFLVFSDFYSPIWDNRWLLLSGFIGYGLGQMWHLLCMLYLERRLLSAIEKGDWVDSDQPIITSSKMMSMPLTVLWHVKWTYLPPWLVIVVWWIAFANWNFILLIIVVLVLLLLYHFFQLKIEVDENGISEGGKGIPQKIVYWSEARFFTCYRLPVLFWGKNIIHYELLSPTARVSWIWVSNFRSPFTAWTTQLAPTEYHQQMQALTAFVKEKTGLSLYNLSSSMKREKMLDVED